MFCCPVVKGNFNFEQFSVHGAFPWAYLHVWYQGVYVRIGNESNYYLLLTFLIFLKMSCQVF